METILFVYCGSRYYLFLNLLREYFDKFVSLDTDCNGKLHHKVFSFPPIQRPICFCCVLWHHGVRTVWGQVWQAKIKRWEISSKIEKFSHRSECFSLAFVIYPVFSLFFMFSRNFRCYFGMFSDFW